MFPVCIKFIIREVLHFKKGAVLTLLRCLLEKGVQIKEILVTNTHEIQLACREMTEVCWTMLNLTDDFKFILKF